MKAWFFLGLLVASLGQKASERLFSPDLRVTFFDVGQGDAALIQFPGTQAWLIDTGGGVGDWNWGRKLGLQLKAMGILTLDKVILSHSDQDHAYGLLGLFDEVAVKGLYYNQKLDALKPPLLKRVRAEASSRQIPIEAVTKPESIEAPDWKANWLPLRGNYSSANDRGLMVGVEAHGCRFLFTGDIEESGEREFFPALKPVEVLKVAHHGSRTSSRAEFLRKARPKAAVISVGRDNRYGHPDSGVLHRLHQVGAQVLRTDFHGFVQFRVDPQGHLRCDSSKGGCGEWDC